MLIIDTDTNCLHHLDSLKGHGVSAIGRYYARAGTKRLTKTEAQAISDAGMRLFVVYEDSGDPVLSIDRGRSDAQLAYSQARSIGQPQGAAIYFAMEHLPHGYDPSHIDGLKAYFEGIRRTLKDLYKVGCYSNGTTLTALLDAKLIDYAWVSASTSFHGSRDFLKTDRWHLAQRKVDLNWEGVSVDTNDAQHPEFGAFALPPADAVADASPPPQGVGIGEGEAGAIAAAAQSSTATPTPNPSPQGGGELQDKSSPKPQRDLDYINEMIEKASRLGANVKNAWTAIKLAFGISVGGTGVVAGAHQVGLIDPSKGNAGPMTSWGAQHPWLMLVIGGTVMLAVFGGILAVFFPKIIRGIVSAYKDGRYTPPGGTPAQTTGA